MVSQWYTFGILFILIMKLAGDKMNNKTMINTNSNKYIIKWLVNYLKLESCNINVAICSKQGKVAFLSPKGNIRKTLTYIPCL